jgi:O-methyltransferase
MKAGIEDRYLDLMKKTLAFALWPEPPIPIETFNDRRPPLKRTLVSAVSRVLKSRQLRLVKERGVTVEDREAGRIWPAYADTMIGLKRLDHLQSCVEAVIRDDIAGDLIEAGVWRGGACILMRAVLAARAIEDRKVYVADSFEGLPKPDAEKYPADRGDTHHTHGFLAVSQKEVENNFKRFSLLDDQVMFLKGWFKDTLPNAPIKKLAILRLDGDMYGSTMDALTSLYPKLSRGGFCIIDDYALEGCRKAVDDFRAEHGIHAEMQAVDWACWYWRKD